MDATKYLEIILKNKFMKRITLLFLFSFWLLNVFAQNNDSLYKEEHRPQIHFSPKKGWMNDPNGMVYNEGVYHLFFQYYPDSTVWGPMHWGHATSKDLIHWKEQPVAIYPDSIGYIFSGSAVLDKNNTSGFGKDGIVPLVAIFTQHDPVGERNGSDTFQTQSIAYSLDNGVTWTKYKNNPVLKNPGIKDFRDPKVTWYEEGKKWIMILAVKDHTEIYSSPDLKNWAKQSEFGKNMGAHGGVWECPDLFSLNDGGKKVWVMMVSINPGGPNGGSGTQYFVGDFDGKTFSTKDTAIKWIDYGPDDYAGVTWSNTSNQKIFLGWMSNWEYAQVVPTTKWRSATTVARDLTLKNINGSYYIASAPVVTINDITLSKETVSKKEDNTFEYNTDAPSILKFTVPKAEDFECTFSNNSNQKLSIKFDKANQRFYLDRSLAGSNNFNQHFSNVSAAPRISNADSIEITFIIDASSIELFADGGLTTMTQLFFPGKPFNKFSFKAVKDTGSFKMSYSHLKSIWNK